MGRTPPKTIEWEGHLYDIHRDGSIYWVGPSSYGRKTHPAKKVKKQWMIQMIMQKAADDQIKEEQRLMGIIAHAAGRNVSP